MKTRILADSEAVALAAASLTASEARAAVAARGRFVVALSGGRTPWTMLRALADEDVPWAGVHVFQVDERVAPDGDPVRNLTHIRENLLAHCPIPVDQVHAMPVEAPDLDEATVRYILALQRVAGVPPVLDLALLGLGPDGHTASLVPNDPVLGVSDADVAISGSYQGRRRMTLTYPVLNRSRRIFWLVTGPEKAEMLPRLLAGDRSIPAGRVSAEQALVLADAAAASQAKGAASPPPGERRATRMRVGIATDHGGFALKSDLVARLRAAGHEVTDFGADTLDPNDDYPDYVVPLGRAVAAGKIERGVAICGSGVGASICANKIPGVHAGLIEDHFSAEQGVEDDHMNVLCLGGRTVGSSVAWDLVRSYLAAQFSQEPRHLRRLAKVASLELETTRANP